MYGKIQNLAKAEALEKGMIWPLVTFRENEFV